MATPHVYEAIASISSELAKEGITKSRKNQQQGYAFRGIDEVLNTLAPLMAYNGLVIIPRVMERECVERITKSGGALFYTTVKVEFDFVSAKDGSKHTACTYGEAMDSADKSTNKSMSAAYKYAAIQTFCIPTEGDNDADATTHEVVAKAAPKPEDGRKKAEEWADKAVKTLTVFGGDSTQVDEWMTANNKTLQALKDKHVDLFDKVMKTVGM